MRVFWVDGEFQKGRCFKTSFLVDSGFIHAQKVGVYTTQTLTTLMLILHLIILGEASKNPNFALFLQVLKSV
jgi:hypothetical protein